MWPSNETVSLSGEISNAYQGAEREKCEMAFSFFTLDFSSHLFDLPRFLLVCDDGAGYDVPVGGCHYKVKFGRLTLLP